MRGCLNFLFVITKRSSYASFAEEQPLRAYRWRRKDRCSPKVMGWYRSVEDQELFLSVLVLGEIRRGIEISRLKDLQAAAALEKWLNGLKDIYSHRIFEVTAEICDGWGRLSPRSVLPDIEGLLAATALIHELTFVTRNKSDILRSGVECLNPFTA